MNTTATDEATTTAIHTPIKKKLDEAVEATGVIAEDMATTWMMSGIRIATATA